MIINGKINYNNQLPNINFEKMYYNDFSKINSNDIYGNFQNNQNFVNPNTFNQISNLQNQGNIISNVGNLNTGMTNQNYFQNNHLIQNYGLNNLQQQNFNHFNYLNQLPLQSNLPQTNNAYNNYEQKIYTQKNNFPQTDYSKKIIPM